MCILERVTVARMATVKPHGWVHASLERVLVGTSFPKWSELDNQIKQLGTCPFLLILDFHYISIYPRTMPRIARIIALGYPHHITLHGNNRSVVFFDDKDRQTYLNLLAGYAQKYALQIWAWCLMDNQIHLLVVPESESSLTRGIGLTNLVYTQYLNSKLGLSGRI